ncbi:MAG TPA: PilZ domain-containing protein [Terriglobales bacterium]|nr:PilZ domain-containing protein [Terriglobales bacterium]
MNVPDQQPSSSPLPHPERRRSHRYTVQVQIELRQEGSDVPMRLETTDLSRNGCYVQLLIPLSVGIKVRAVLWLDGHPVVIRGRVVTRHPQFGNGIMFLDFEADAEQRLSRYLEAISAD